MQITNQTNPNECGVCVINSLVQHFYHKSDKLAILNDANLSNNGMSIFNFEYLAQQYGIFVETFQLDWSEFVTFKNNEYFVCPIKKNGGLHYVIVKKYKHTIEIYDSDIGRHSVNLKEFINDFAGIIMVVSKSTTKIKIERLGKVDLWQNLDWKYLLINLLMQLVIVTTSTITADYFNIMINHAIMVKSIANGLIISLIFAIFFLLEELMHYILGLYCSKHFKINFQYFSHKLIHSLHFKKRSFFNKVDQNYFYLIDTAMQSMTAFITNEISSFCANIVLVLVSTIAIVIINFWFLIIVVISIMVMIIFNFIQYYYRKYLMRIGLKNQKTSNSIIHRYINYLNNQKNTIIQTALDQSLEHNYAEFQHIYLLQAKFNNGLTFFETMIHNLIYLLVGMLGCYLIIEQQNINIGQLIFLISLLGLMSGAFNGICGFIIKRIEYEQMSEIYKKFIMVDNYKNEGGKVIDEITSISINQKNLFSGEKYKHEPSLIKQLLLDENDQKDFYINDININNIDCSSYLSKIFLINYDTKINKERIYQNFDQHNSFFLKTMKAFKINLTSCDSLDVYEQSLINIATTTLLKNKIIILDDCLRYVSNSNKRWINKNLIPFILENNYVLIFD